MAGIEKLECQGCGVFWEREIKKGWKPKLCPDCKEDPARVKALQDETTAASRAASRKRVDNLETMLRANGSHLSQQPTTPISYSIRELVERITRLEEWRDSLEAGSLAPSPEAVQEPDPPAANLHKQPRKGVRQKAAPVRTRRTNARG